MVNQKIYNLEEKNFKDAETVIECDQVCKQFNLVGRTEQIYALKSVTLKEDDEFFPIKRLY
jgi:hypothetical protein